MKIALITNESNFGIKGGWCAVKQIKRTNKLL